LSVISTNNMALAKESRNIREYLLHTYHMFSIFHLFVIRLRIRGLKIGRLPNLITRVSKKLFCRNMMKLKLQNIVIAWPCNYLQLTLRRSSYMRELITQLIIFLNFSYYSRLRFIYSLISLIFRWSISCSLRFPYFRFRKFHIYQTLFGKKVSIKLNPFRDKDIGT